MPPVTDKSVGEFLDELASNASTPGGGSAAALGGALGAGLVSMVCQFTVGREKYAEVEDDMQRVLARSEELRAELGRAVQEDVEAYGSYSRASALPRDSDEEKAARAEALQVALRESTEVPLGVAERCVELLDLAVEAAEKGNVYLISDAAVGAEMAAAARASAELNARLNAGGLKDREFASACEERLAELERRAPGRELAERATRIVEERNAG